MGNVLKMLQPSSLWKYFEEISSIPHTSHNLSAITEYIISFANSRNLEYKKDTIGNIVVRKKAAQGMENRKCVILQAHMDMVGQKNENVSHDFKKDSIKLKIENGYVTADGTTLGADNGIGLAAILALLDSPDIQIGIKTHVFLRQATLPANGFQSLYNLLHQQVIAPLSFHIANYCNNEIKFYYILVSGGGFRTFQTLFCTVYFP